MEPKPSRQLPSNSQKIKNMEQQSANEIQQGQLLQTSRSKRITAPLPATQSPKEKPGFFPWAIAANVAAKGRGIVAPQLSDVNFSVKRLSILPGYS
jgi:hypothetical protein